LKCPVCNGNLVIDSRGGVEVMRCGSCGGYWVQKNNLGLILEKYMKHLAARSDKKKVRNRVNPWEVEKVKLICPECGRGMRKLNYAYNSNVIVDKCETCNGVWLDEGEIEKIGDFLRFYGMPKKFWEDMRQIKESYKRHGSDGGEAIVSNYSHEDNHHGGFFLGVLLGALLRGLLGDE